MGLGNPPTPRSSAACGGAFSVDDEQARVKGHRAIGKTIAAITLGEAVGGGFGLMIGPMQGADNPFVYTTTGIAVGVQAPP